MTRCVLALILFCAQSASAWGVVISTGNGSGNTSPPADDPGFRNIGGRNAASAIYLGNRWVLTSNHVGAGSTIFDGMTYGLVAGSQIQLRNPTGVGVSEFTDLLLYQIDGTPSLPALNIAGHTPALGTNVVMIGRGRDRSEQQLAWDINWNPTTGIAAYSGYGWLSTGSTMRWGTNVVDYTSFVKVVQNSSQASFLTDFDAIGTAYEAQGAAGDSGGGVFAKNTATGQWELAGVMFSIAVHPGQPYGICAFGNSTYSADLSVYRNQIYSYIRLPGDITLDGVIDIFDVNQVSETWGTTSTLGDANYDGIVDIFDLNLVSMNWTTGATGGASAVPEPSSLALLVAGIVLLARSLGRRTLGRRTR